MSARRASLARRDRVAAGDAVARIACALPEFECARRVAAYVALDDEVPTRAILDAVLASGRVLLLPRLAAKRLEFAAVAGLTALRRGGFGVFEPQSSSAALELAPDDLVFLPGVAFDRRGGRLGRGGGHYDRAFPPATAAPLLLGVAFSFQLVDAVPVGPADRRVDGIVTELGIVRTAIPPRDPTRDPG